MRLKLTLYFCLLLLFFDATVLLGGNPHATYRLQDSVCVGGKDSINLFVYPKTGNFKNVSIDNFVTLGIDQDYYKFVKDSAVYKVYLTIEGYDVSDNLISTTSHTFSVTYDPFGNNSFRDKDIYKFSNAYRMRVTFTGGTKNGSNISCLPDYLFVDADIELEQYFNFGAYATTAFTMNTAVANNIDCDSANIADELVLSWNSMLGGGTVKPELYELEWAFVNDYDTATGLYKSASTIKYDFRGNSTRIQTANNSYTVSLIYDHGYLLYRVRGIGQDTANPNNTIWGVWSLTESGTVSSASPDYYHITTPHENNKNWQYNSSFAEEGKKKEVVSYFDGSLRNRQSVTKTNSNNHTLVGETIYDHDGRAAVNILPVPVDNPTCTVNSEAVIMYYPNFNRDDSSFVYSRNDFDVDSAGTSCDVKVGAMNTTYGASHYYSPNNPNKNAQQAFVPDAKKYPFTQVEYTPDNTGRIKRQGGVGPKHQLNTGHETIYLYGQPTQVELDRMFGSEVGDATHYKKNIVIDANGQISISYLDMEGRTIATTLAGDSATGLAKIASNSNPVTLTADLFNKDAHGNSKLDTIDLSGHAVEFNSQLLVAQQGNHIFSYSVSVDTLADSCLRANVCFNCIYDLQLRVYDDCGTDLIAAKYGSNALNRTIGHFTLDSLNNLVFTDSCQGPTSFSSQDTLFLDPGNYTISKVLTVNQKAVDYYVNRYLDTTYNGCYKDLNSFVQAEMNNIDTSGCHIDCSSCLSKLGDRDAFVAEGKGTYMEYDALADACQAPCKAKSDCYIRLLQLIADVSLGGQYGEYVDNNGAQNPSAFPLSVYNTSNKLPKNMAGPDSADWQHPRVTLNGHTYYHYVNEDGSISTINLSKSGSSYTPAVVDTLLVKYDSTTSSYYTYIKNLANFSDFYNSWSPSWAKCLVVYHPEYCYYEGCKGFGETQAGDYTTSDDFDNLLRNTKKFSDAVALGFIKWNYASQSYSSRLHDYTDVNDSLPYDPFITNSVLYGTYSSQLSAILTNYSPKPYSTSYNFSLGEIAAFYSRCGYLPGYKDTAGCIGFGTGADSIKDHEWQMLTGLYLSKKQSLQQQYLDAYVKGSGCPGYSGCFGDSSNSFSPSALGSQYSNAGQPCGLYTEPLYANKIRRFAGATSVLPTSVNQLQYEAYLATGQCPMAYGLQTLLNELGLNSKLKSATALDLDNYSTFTSDMYTALGGLLTTHSKFYWNSSTSGSIISASFKDVIDSVKCTLSLDLAVSGFSSLTNYLIMGATGLADTTGSYPNSFRVYLVLKDTVNDTILIKKAIGHSSCFSIDGCKFTQTCTPNDFASDLQTMMSRLALHHDLGQTNVSLDKAIYYSYITPFIKNQLSTTTSNKLIWNYDDADNVFELYDSLVPSLRIWINLGGDTSVIGHYFGQIYSFKGINANFFNNFTVTALDTIGGNSTLNGYVIKKIVMPDSVLGGISLGSCGYPPSLMCYGEPYKLQNDLQALINDALVLMPAGHSVDLTKLPSYSQTIANALPFGLSVTTSTVVTDTTEHGPYQSQLLFSVTGTSDSCYFSLNADTLHAFDSIVQFEKLAGYGPTDSYGNYHAFYGLATYALSDTTLTDTIFGKSCLPILNCCACGTTDTVVVTELYSPTDTCAYTYQLFLAGIDSFNATPFAIAHSYTIAPGDLPTYYDVTYFGYCNCLMGYITYLQNYTDTTTQPYSFFDVQNLPCPNALHNSSADKVCMRSSQDYFNLVASFNSMITSYSPSTPLINDSIYSQFSFNVAGFCSCWPAYKAYLQSIINHSLPPANIDTTILDIADFCNSNYDVPCQVYVAPDTGGVFPSSFGVGAPEDTSCVQQAINIAVLNGQNAYHQYRDSLTTIIASKYISHCLNAVETLTDQYPNKEYHYTLYYYDQAGNLIRTIPPEGMKLTGVTGPPTVPISSPTNAADSICWDRTFRKHLFTTAHTLPTTYLYNSLNQLVKQNLPDHDPIDIWEYTLPNGLNSNLKVTGLQFVNDNTGYLTGYTSLGYTISPGIDKRGYLYVSNNGGHNWTQMNGLVDAQLNKVQMPTNKIGYAVGKNGLVLKTADGGITWDIVPTLQEYTGTWKFAPEWKDLYFKDTVRGIITGTQGKSLLIDLTQTNPANYIKTISLPGDSTDILTGVTYDGSYAYASSVTHDGFGRIYKSTLDPFATDSLVWTMVSGISTSDLLAVQFTPSNNNKGFASGIKGTLVRTRDAGSHWESVVTGFGTDIQDVFFRNDSVGVAVVDSVSGKAKLYKTSNGGKTWTQISGGGKYYTALASYPSSNSSTKDKAFAVGKKGVVERVVATTNVTAPYYGASPYFGVGVVNSPTDKPVFNCASVATYTATVAKPKLIIGADNGKLYYSQRADTSVLPWDSLALSAVAINKVALRLNGTNHNMQAVAIDNAGSMYGVNFATGDTTITSSLLSFSNVVYSAASGKFYAYETSGKQIYEADFTTGANPKLTLTAKNINASLNTVKDITLSGSDLVVVGTSGDIYKDSLLTGTPTWVNESQNMTLLPLTDIQSDPSASPAVYAVGYNGTFLQKPNGGNWSKVATDCNKKFNAIKFKDAATGLVAGDAMKMYKVAVSGGSVTLTSVASPTTTSNNLNDLVVTATGAARIVGASGTIVTISNITSPVASLGNFGANTHDLNGVSVTPSLTYCAVGGNNNIHLLGGGGIFKATELHAREVTKAHFYDMANGYIIGDHGFIRHTADGQNWSTVLPRLTYASLDTMLNVYTYAQDKGILLGKDTFLAKLSGTGTPTFVTTGLTGAPDLCDINFGANSPSMGYVVGANKTAFKLTLPAFTITSLPTLPLSYNYDLKAAHVFLDNSVMAVGTKGAIVFYNAYSNTWYSHGVPHPAGTTDSLRYSFNDVYFHDDRTGYVVGDTGVVMRWNSTNNIQKINLSTTSVNTYFTQKATRDILGATDSTLFNIKAVAFPGRYDGMLAGMYPANTSNALYARLVHDESQYYSTYFWYDALGRMVLSQNSKQYSKNPKTYSYTKYDALGRITEVGEKPENTGSSQTRFANIFGQIINGYNFNIINNDSLQSWIAAGSRTEVTHTYYDEAAVDSIPITQENLRKRVSAVTYEDTDDGNVETYNHATFYSYDIHGNVKSLLQDNPSLASIKQRFKKIDYDYDLISGKVNNVYYEKDSLDAFTHHYEYDADNRITEVHTSSYPHAKWRNYKDNLWDNDAKYFYYDHGPLARVEYGDHHVQGVDYYYTIQGWIKGVNSNILTVQNDGGADGYNISTNAHKNFGKDAYGYTLGYFSGDYSPIDTSKWNTVSKRFEANSSGSSLASARYDLFNGNIGHMVTTLIQPDTNYANQTILPQGTAYKYDQLNRLIEMKAFINITNNAFGTTTYDGRYNNRFVYDANGNILSQVRKKQNGTTFDSLTYRYKKDALGNISQNRLYHVNDTIAANVMNDDIDNQGSFNAANATINAVNNYSYDKIGNLVRDSAEGIATIDWTVYGKIKSVTHRTGYYRLNGTDTVRPPDLAFNYDAAGNRISKVVKPRTSTTTLGDTAWTTTHYVRDAQGNVMSVYTLHDSAAISQAYFKQIEKHVYGSSRLGIDQTRTELLGTSFSTDTFSRTLGDRSYELSNHLGNVLTTISDKKIPVDTNANDSIDFYVADIRSATDYSSYGGTLDGRNFNSSKYDYGMNGQLHENELFEGAYSAEYWMYDSRLGRRWNMDPKPHPGVSVYSAFANNPIWFSDPLGDTITVDLFDPKKDEATYHNVAKAGASKQTNDGVFLVYAHAHSGGIQYTDKKGNLKLAQSGEEFNKVMSERSAEYKQAMKDGKQIVIKLYACNTASEEYVAHNGAPVLRDKTIAEKISENLPANSAVVAADGYVWYGQKDGKPAILGVQQTTKAEPDNTGKGGFVTIKDGKKVAKQQMSYDNNTKKTTTGAKMPKNNNP